MTKRNLLLVSVLLVFGLAAYAPTLFAATSVGTSWRISNNTNYFARSEGDAESVGAITLTSLGTGTIAASTYLYIDYNAPIASNASGYAVSVTYGGDNAFPNGCVTLSIGSYPADFTQEPFVTPLTNNEVVLNFTCSSGVPVDATDTITVVSRVNVQTYPNDFTVQGNIRAQYSNNGYAVTLSSNYPQNLTMAEIEGGESSTFLTATTVSFYKGPEYVLTCIGIKDVPGTSLDNKFVLNIAENWGNALTSLSDEYSLENDTWANVPTNGSNILITLSEIPPLVGVVAEDAIPCWQYVKSPCADNDALVIAAPVAGAQTTLADGNGQQSFWYQVESTNVGVIESANFPFHLWSKGPLPPNQSYGIKAQVWLTDLFPSTAGDMPYFSEPEDQPTLSVEFFDCRTNLLFPYVNTFQGGSGVWSSFGTGINVSNTTLDPFGLVNAAGNLVYPDMAKGAAVPQSGSCTFYFYPANNAIAPTVYTTGTVGPGASVAFDVGATAGWKSETGYAIAICNFQNAHGFAEIYDNYLNLSTTGPTTTATYIADVLPDPAFYRRSPAGDGLGETAIAPISIPHFLQKLLMTGKILQVEE